ncbi:Aldo-keto reductase family 4 member C9 [Spatholobus suberectus]|nr:Aldo-keto reductase family 4 member C9 [Spatholobus suberectus]
MNFFSGIFSTRLTRIFQSDDILKNPVIIEVAEKLGKTPAQVALRWGLQAGHSVLPKSTNESRIRGNFDVFDWSITEDLVTKFSEIKQERLVNAHFLLTRPMVPTGPLKTSGTVNSKQYASFRR